MNLPQVYMCSPSWTFLPPPSPFPPSGSSQCTSPKHPVSCIEPGLATSFIHDILHVSMPFSQIFPPSPSPTESIRLFYTSVSLLLSRTQGKIICSDGMRSTFFWTGWILKSWIVMTFLCIWWAPIWCNQRVVYDVLQKLIKATLNNKAQGPWNEYKIKWKI